MTSTTKFKVVGISEETDCECCGKQGLKLTVVLARLDTEGNAEEFVKFGRDCASKAMMMRCTANKMESIAREAQAAEEKRKAEFVHQVGETRSVVNWVIASIGCNGGKIDIVTRANGSRAEVEAWARKQYPNKFYEVMNPNAMR